MKDVCSALCPEVLFLFGPLALATLAAVIVLLTNWVLSFPRDSNRSS